MKLGIIGAGYMGQAHARVLNEIAPKFGHSLSFIVEPDEQKAKMVSSKFGVGFYKDIDEAIRSEGNDVIPVVASPTFTHLEILEKLIESGIEYIFVEKPLGDDVQKAKELAGKYPKSILEKVMVGHIERFNPAYQELKNAIAEGVLGNIISITSRRVGPFVARISDVGVVLDLAIHDIDLSIDLAGKTPEKVYSFYYYRYSKDHEDSCFILLDYDTHIHSIEANRVTPYKERKAIITGTNGVAQLDFMQQSLEVYTGKWKMERMIQKREPLTIEDEAFLSSVASGSRVPITFFDGLKNLEIAHKALENGKNKRKSQE
ncbi:MAG: Gfo/Idh/MocA family oxidoreductase [Fervidicoccaceae archaeon]